MKKIKILQVVSTISKTNGALTYMYNYFSNMNLDSIEMSFVATKNGKQDYCEEIEKKGGIIYELFRIKNPFKYAKTVDIFFKEHDFDIVHCNVSNVGLFFLYYAKKHGVKVRILHSHATVSADKLSHRIRNDLIIPFTRKFANVYFACSEAAGVALFKNKKFIVINNGINYEKFKFDSKKRKQIKKELKLEDKIIIGNVGRLCNQKNQKFLLNNIDKLDEKHHLLIIGDGPLKEKYVSIIKEKKAEKKVTLLDSKKNIEDYYSAMDIFALPSLYEGLPVVGIEAQVNGLGCLLSDKITNETDISGKVKFIGIDSNNSTDIWMEEFNKVKKDDIHKNSYSKDYDIRECAIKLEKLYKELVNKYQNND